MYYDGDLKSAVMKTTSRLEGSYAIGVLCADCPGTIMAVREASPLILGIGVPLTSQLWWLTPATPFIWTTANLRS